MKRRAETDGRVQAVFGATDEAALTAKLAAADIAFARVNDTAALARASAPAAHHGRHAARARSSMPAPAARRAGEARHYGPVPALGEHTDKIRAEFLPSAKRA